MFAVDVGGKTQIRGRKVVHVVEVEDTISTLWEEIKSQPEELEDKYFFEEFEDNIDTLQPTSKESKLYQSSFKFKDMANHMVVERGVCGNSLVPWAPLKLMISRGNLPYGVSSKNHAIPTLILTWCRVV
jgi:hypothetical protein